MASKKDFVTVIPRSCLRLWDWYVRKLNSTPMLTDALGTGLLCGLGDVIAQQTIEGRSLREHNWKRTGNVALIGFAYIGPFLRVWFVTLDRILGPTRRSTDALKKMVLDQGICAPVMIATILPMYGISQGLNWTQTKERLQRDYFNTVINFYKVWPVVQLVNFYIIPLRFRVGVVNLVSLAWNTYVAWVAHKQ